MYNASWRILCLQHNSYNWQHDSERSSPTIYSSLITFIETVKLNFHCVLHYQASHLLPDCQLPGDQPERLAGYDHLITVVPGLPGQSLSTPIAPRPRRGW